MWGHKKRGGGAEWSKTQIKTWHFSNPLFRSFHPPRPPIVSPVSHLAVMSAPLPQSVTQPRLLTLPLSCSFALCVSETAAHRLSATRSQSTVPLSRRHSLQGAGTPSFWTLTKKIKKLAQRDVQQQLKTCLKVLCEGNIVRVPTRLSHHYFLQVF